jgi:hypothetical protein
VLVTALQAIVIPQQVSVSLSGQAFDEAGQLAAEPPANLLRVVCQALFDLSARIGPAD